MSLVLQNPIWGYILAVVGIAASVYFGIKGKRVKKLSFLKRTRRLILPRDMITPELHVFFCDKEIGNVSVSFYTIWNSGTETIQHDEIVPSRPVTIESSEDGEVLDAQIIKKSDDSCSFSVSAEANKVRIMFDYVEPHDGVVLQIIHTGSISDLTGKIKGGKLELFKPERKTRKVHKIIKGPFRKLLSTKANASFSIVFLLFIICFAVACSLRFFDLIPQDSKVFDILFVPTSSKIGLGVMAIISWFMCYVYYTMSSMLIKRAFQLGVPAKLRIEEDERI